MKPNNRILRYLLLCLFAIFSTNLAFGQIPADIEKAYDDFMNEYIKVQEAIKNYDEDKAVQVIRSLKPVILEKARAMNALEFSAKDLEGSEEYEMDVENKPYYIKMIEYMNDKEFLEKNSSQLIQAELLAIREALDEIWPDEDYEEDMATDYSHAATVAIIEIQENSSLSGRKLEVKSTQENAVVVYDDAIESLSFDITGIGGGYSYSIMFFTEGQKAGRVDWATEGHIVIEIYTESGEEVHSFWGNEGQGYIQVDEVGGIGEFVVGSFSGKFMDTMKEDQLTQVSGSFRIRRMDLNGEY